MKTEKLKTLENKEKLITLLSFIFSYLVLVFMIGMIYINIVDKLRLDMKFDSEKHFNSVFMAINENQSKALSVMQKENISAIGTYTSNGFLYQGLGDVPEILSLVRMKEVKNVGDDTATGTYFFDRKKGEIEYYRLSRFLIAFGGPGATISTKWKYAVPDILYIRFSDNEYRKDIRHLNYVTILSLISLTAVIILTYRIFLTNRRLQMEANRNKNLVQLGAAARTLTHEIKNPLSAMTIQSALLRKELPSKYLDDLNLIDHEIQRLTNLTNKISDFLKNPLGNPTAVELISFLSDLCKLFSKPVKTDFGSIKSVYVEFDIDRIRSVFENLIKNACESTEERDPEVEVKVQHGRANFIIVKICDRGDGFPNDSKDKIFDPFFTTKIHGSGIGLSISRQFVQACGGSLKLYSRDGGGTVAEVVLKGRTE